MRNNFERQVQKRVQGAKRRIQKTEKAIEKLDKKFDKMYVGYIQAMEKKSGE